jgi:xanthosine utilization system XapX-like protein
MTRRGVVQLSLAITGFVALAVGIVVLVLQQVISPAMGLLSLIALLGLYVGFGILIGVYRLISRLD